MTEEGPDCWTLLGIAPTGDLKSIRRVYAQRLKTIDIERDPRAFIALRSAYEAALHGVVPAPASAARDAPSPSLAAGPDGSAEMDAILALLRGRRPPSEIAAPLSDLTERLITQSRSVSIAESEAIEIWLAETIDEHVPRTNGMVAPTVAAFRWDARASSYDCPETVLYVVERHRDLAFLRELQRLNPAYRLAWTALTEGGVDFESVHAGCMTTLLGIVQYQRPGLIDDIDIGHFQRWTDYLETVRAAERRAVAVEQPPRPAGSPNLILSTAISVCILVAGVAINLRMIYWLVLSSADIEEVIFGFVAAGTIGGLLIALALDRLKRQLGEIAHHR